MASTNFGGGVVARGDICGATAGLKTPQAMQMQQALLFSGVARLVVPGVGPVARNGKGIVSAGPVLLRAFLTEAVPRAIRQEFLATAEASSMFLTAQPSADHRRQRQSFSLFRGALLICLATALAGTVLLSSRRHAFVAVFPCAFHGRHLLF